MSRFEKRVIAIVIAMVMVLSNLTTGPIVANANEAENYTVAVCDEEMVGTISEADGNITYEFTPATTGKYTVMSVGDMDTYGEIYDSAMNLIYSDNDSGEELNYAIDADLEEGQTYYIISSMFSEVETGDITTVITENDSAIADTTEVVEEATDSDATEVVVDTATLTDAGETVSADEVYVSGDYEYKILEDNTVNIVKYNGTATTVNVPSTIDGKTVSKLDKTFMSNVTVTSVTIPNTVTEMQYGVFCGAKNLKTVTFASGSNLELIGEYCFVNSGIESITVPNKVKTVGLCAFSNCSNLKTANIPDSVTCLSDRVFMGCESLTDVTIGSGVTSLMYGLFYGCTSLEKFTLPKNVTVIHSSCFIYSGLKNIKWNDKITTIESGAFACCHLSELYIPETVTSIGGGAFSGITELKKVVFNDSITIVSNSLFSGSGIEEIDLGNSKIIEDYAFGWTNSLKSIDIPDSVTDIQYKAFLNSDNLTNIKMSKNIERVEGHSFNNTAWYKSQEDGVLYLDNVLYGYKGTMPANTNFTVNNDTKVIASVAFLSQSNLNSVILPYGVTHINDYAFFDCENMKSIYIPSSVEEIGDYSLGYRLPNEGEKGTVDQVYNKFDYYISHLSALMIEDFVIIGDKGSAAEAYAIKHGITFKERELPKTTVKYRTHVQSIGWQKYVSNGEMAGTSGKAKRLEGINIFVEGNPQLGIQYTTHCQSYGWLPWSADGDMSGTEKEAKRLEAIKIQLTGPDAKYYDVYYRVHAQTYGWLGWAKNGEPSGTAGYGKRLEGIQVVILKKGESAPGLNYKGVNATSSKNSNKSYIAKDGNSPVLNNTATSNKNPVVPGTNTPNVVYRTHVQKYGWQGWKYNGSMSGTSGEAKRLEGIEIKLTNKPYEGDIVYTTHVQKYGWKDGKPEESKETWKGKNGSMSGTSGEAKRLEAICIDLTGEMAEHYDVYYRVHAQSFGWLGWAKNGEESGTAGYAKRLEGIQIVLVPKGTAPTSNYGGIISKDSRPYISK